MKHLSYIIALTFLLSFQGFSQATPYTQAHFVSSHEQVSEGESFKLGLYLQFDQDWHTYWQNPGDSGAKPKLNFSSASHELSVGKINWPTPSRFTVSGLNTFIYKEEVLLWVDASIANLSEHNTPIEVNLQAEWLVCKESCVPAFKNFTLKLKTGSKSHLSKDHSFLFQQYQDRLPHSKTIQAQVNLLENSSLIKIHQTQISGTVLDFLPLEFGKVLYEKPGIQLKNDIWEIELTRNEVIPFETLSGLLISDQESYIIEASTFNPIKTKKTNEASKGFSWTSLLKFCLFAFIGGALLNLMPCVFPIISLKLFSVLKNTSSESTKQIQQESLSYAVGVFVSFLGIAFLLIVLKQFGYALGWGFQLQSPYFLVFLSFVFMALSLSFLDLFEVHLPIPKFLSPQSSSPLLESFFAGILAVVVASPCSAPFLGVAMGFALGQSTLVLLLIFIFLSLGFSLPYLILALQPKLLSFLPKSGPWLQHFKTFLFFPLLFTTLWLVWLLGQSKGIHAAFLMLAALGIFSLGIWVQRTFKSKIGTLISLTIFALSFLMSWNILSRFEVSDVQEGQTLVQNIKWEDFSKLPLETIENPIQATFVDFTADWCLTCKVNELATFQNADVLKHIKENNIRMVKADWTQYDGKITKFLQRFNRVSVPFYLYYPANSNEPKILPELMNASTFIKHTQSK